MTETDTQTGGPYQAPTLTVDWEAYAAMLDESDWTEDQKRELVETLWSIVVAFVDLGFGVHPAQQACGEHPNSDEFDISDMVSLSPSPEHNEQAEAGYDLTQAWERSQAWDQE